MNDNWPFDQVPDAVALTTVRVLEEGLPIYRQVGLQGVNGLVLNGIARKIRRPMSRLRYGIGPMRLGMEVQVVAQ
ncbi:MAG: hypothetical protein U0795_17680 [Pirellulales bacterium]